MSRDLHCPVRQKSVMGGGGGGGGGGGSEIKSGKLE